MPSNKYWGKVDKAALASLVEDGDININGTSLEYTASVHSDNNVNAYNIVISIVMCETLKLKG